MSATRLALAEPLTAPIAIPPHIIALADDASSGARAVLADWLEEQDDVRGAERLRAGGVGALIVALALQGKLAPSGCHVFLDGRLLFRDAAIEISIERHSLYGEVPRRVCNAKTRGVPLFPFGPKHPREVAIVAGGNWVGIEPHSWSIKHSERHRDVIVFDVSGLVTLNEDLSR